MARGHGPHRKKEPRRQRGERKGGGNERKGGSNLAATLARQAATATSEAPRSGVEATRGPVSGAFRAWASDFARRQAEALAQQFDGLAPPELFVLAPLTARTVGTPGGDTASIQMGLPIVATRSGGVTVAPDRLAVIALRLPAADPSAMTAMLGMGAAPDMPQPELVFAAQLPGEGLRGCRPADAIAWYLARALEAGDVPLEPRALGAATGEALALLRPTAVPRDAPRLDPAALEAYEGYGAETDEDAVPPDITAPPARGGLAGLPSGAFAQDNGAPLTPLLADLRDYVIGLWPYDYFGLEALTGEAGADGPRRGVTLAALAELVRRLDDYLARAAEEEDAALAAEGRPPAWIAEETAHYREARQSLRSTRTAQELLPLLGPILFDLELPPEDYQPESLDDELDQDEDEDEDEA